MGPTSASGKTNIEKGVKPLTIQQIATIEIPVTNIPGLSLGMNRF